MNRRQPVQLYTIPGGYEGSTETIQRMRSIVRSSLVQPTVVGCANRIIMFRQARDTAAQSREIRSWLDGHFRFVRDPVGVELLRTPLQQLSQIDATGFAMGDCDDAAILGAAMGMANGIPAVFRIIGFAHGPPGSFAHVYTILTPPGQGAIDLDVTKPAQGAAVPVRFRDFVV